MAKKIKEDSKTAVKKENLKTLLRSRLPVVFEREPAPAYVEIHLESLVNDIVKLCS